MPVGTQRRAVRAAVELLYCQFQVFAVQQIWSHSTPVQNCTRRYTCLVASSSCIVPRNSRDRASYVSQSPFEASSHYASGHPCVCLLRRGLLAEAPATLTDTEVCLSDCNAVCNQQPA